MLIVLSITEFISSSKSSSSSLSYPSSILSFNSSYICVFSRASFLSSNCLLLLRSYNVPGLIIFYDNSTLELVLIIDAFDLFYLLIFCRFTTSLLTCAFWLRRNAWFIYDNFLPLFEFIDSGISYSNFLK